jgi:hypothetical protein
MSALRKILILCVIFLSLLILWYLLLQRSEIQKLPTNSYQAGQEGFLDWVVGSSAPSFQATPTGAQTNELMAITSTTVGPGVTTYDITALGDLPLREYCIKASYNTACTGRYMNLEMIKYVLARGCRFLDFEIYVVDGFPVVACSNDPTGLTWQSNNYLVLNDVFLTIMHYAFQAPSPNLGDPLFIQLRMFSADTPIHNDIATAIQTILGPRHYNGYVSGDKTYMSDLMGKIVIINDQTISTFNSNVVNMQSGSVHMLKYSPEEISDMLVNKVHVIDSTQLSDVKTLCMVELDKSKQKTSRFNMLSYLIPSSPITGLDITYLVQNYGVQIVECPFYLTGSVLTNYEQFFADNKTAFVPFYRALPYLGVKS